MDRQSQDGPVYPSFLSVQQVSALKIAPRPSKARPVGSYLHIWFNPRHTATLIHMKTFFGRKDRGSFEVDVRVGGTKPWAGKDRILRVEAIIGFEAEPSLWENTQEAYGRSHRHLLVYFCIWCSKANTHRQANWINYRNIFFLGSEVSKSKSTMMSDLLSTEVLLLPQWGLLPSPYLARRKNITSLTGAMAKNEKEAKHDC